MKNKNIKVFLALLITAVVIGATYFFVTHKNNTPSSTQTADQTSNWKTYSNSVEKYSFEYPSTWVPEEKWPGRFHDTTGEQSFDVYIVSSFDTYEAWVNGRETSKIKESQNIQVDNLPALKIVGQGVLQDGADFYNIDTVVKYNGKVLSLGGSLLSHSPDKIEKFNSLYDQILSTFKFITPASSVDTSSWTVYTNKTFGYSLKFPTTYQVPPQTEKQKSQVGIDNNVCVKKNTAGNECIVLIDSFKNSDNLSLEDYVNKNLKIFGLFEVTDPLASPLVSYKFNGYDALFNKNEYVFVKHGQYVYHINAPKASSDKEVGDIVATFKFTL